MNRLIDRETARVESIDPERLVLSTSSFDGTTRESIFLNFELDGLPYFFSADFQRNLGEGRVAVDWPVSIYRAERRSRVRSKPARGDARWVSLEWDGSDPIEAEVSDISAGGVAVRVPARGARYGERLVVRPLDGERSGHRLFGEVRSESRLAARGWIRLGIDLSSTPRGDQLNVERRSEVYGASTSERAQRGWKVASAGVRVAADRVLRAMGRRTPVPEVRVVDYENERGENLRAIVDSWGDSREATVVVVPPAWGRTKETLMPLAASIVAGFRGSREPVAVVRFDGIRKRGESFNDPVCTEPGSEHHRFTFSQGVRDIQATLDFLDASDDFQADRVFLVSFSAASIESRRAAAVDPRVAGWVCVVGASDAQSMMRVISGGIDYGFGLEQGARFGLQEILGVEVDMDFAGLDAIENRLVYLDDSRTDMAKIHAPVTWIHGRHDAWMDGDRARDILSRGDTSNRRFIEVPTGHMLRTSVEALETFQLITQELGRMALGRDIRGVVPNLGELSRRQRAERERLRVDDPDVRSFWRDYLVGRDGTIGIELMTSIAPYRHLMRAQIDAMDLRPGQRIADLGSGTGALPLALLDAAAPSDLRITEFDYVQEGLQRARDRLVGQGAGWGIDYVEADLDRGAGSCSFPVGPESFDVAVASLLLSYLARPEVALREMHRILRPGGRLVLSTLRRDADMSKLFTEGLDELRREGGGFVSLDQLDEAARRYMNEASRLLDLEESGVFRFWDLDELKGMVERAGFDVLGSFPSFGEPPQAIILSASRR